MNILSRLRLSTKLALLMGLCVVTVAVTVVVAATSLHRGMTEERIDKLRAVVQSTINIAEALEKRVTKGQITREQAVDLLRDDIHAIRFDAGVGYVFGLASDGVVVAHGANPSLEGKPLLATDGDGRLLTAMINEALHGADEAVLSYVFPKPGFTEPQPKMSYVARFAPWQMTMSAGAYIDDLAVEFRAALLRLGASSGAILGLTMLLTWFVNRDISGSLNRLMTSMQRVAGGELDAKVAGADRGDEVGSMARAALVFRDHMVTESRLAAEQADERQRAATQQRAALTDMAHKIETETAAALEHIQERAQAMTATAEEMSASAGRTGTSAGTAANAAALALANAQTVASAAEELATSIREIGGQVSQSSAVVGRALTAGGEARATIAALSQEVERIGAVADMIGEIAAKTNLLALNATIEAARAGDAGKGFAVVASEVKQLATQTARSTQEIGQHISQVRSATGASVAAVARIEQTIIEIEAIAGSVTAAVEQQGAATAEIARNVIETATAAAEMTARTTEVSAEAVDTGRHAIEVRTNASGLTDAMEDLRHSVIRVVRTSSRDVDRRDDRRRPCLVDATLGHDGQSVAASVQDISERGCYAIGTLHCGVGSLVDIVMPRYGKRLRGIVREQIDNTLHIKFEGDGLTAAEADRISLDTTKDLVELAKGDHIAFVKRVADAVETNANLPATSLASSHHCRLGRWYDHISDPITLALPAFKAIDEPHHQVHDAGRRALVALAVPDMPTAKRCVAEMRQHSERVLHCLAEFASTYAATAEGAVATTAAA